MYTIKRNEVKTSKKNNEIIDEKNEKEDNYVYQYYNESIRIQQQVLKDKKSTIPKRLKQHLELQNLQQRI